MAEEPDEIRLLLIEDSEDDAVLVVNRLRRAGLRVDTSASRQLTRCAPHYVEDHLPS